MDGSPADSVALGAFFEYALRRSLMMLAAGLAATVAGSVLAVATGDGTTASTLILVIVGVALVVGSFAGLRSLREARRAAAGPSQPMELQSWPYRSVRSPANNRVLVTLDRPGSINRTPLAEFKATWFTPGAAESGQRASRVYGSVSKGFVVLAVADDGSCFAGRVTRTRG